MTLVIRPYKYCLCVRTFAADIEHQLGCKNLPHYEILLCLSITFKWYAHAIDGKEFQANVSLIGAIGFKGEKDEDNSNPPDVSLCKITTKTTEPVAWSLCRDQQPSLIDIPNTPLTAENWGAK